MSAAQLFHVSQKTNQSMNPEYPIYLDYNATTPLHPLVARAMSDSFGENWFDGNFGNASSAHFYGNKAHDSLENARSSVASLLCCQKQEIIFTSCGSESNNIVVFGACQKFKRLYPTKTCEIIISSVEHPSIKQTCQFVQELYNAKIIEIPVDHLGQIDTKSIVDKVSENTCLISIMFANNEIGTLLNVPEVFSIIQKQKEARKCEFPYLHSDCAQAVGKVPVLVNILHCDFLSLAGHKFYGPKGVGALYIRSGIEIPRTILHGAPQENGLRPGTENIAGIIGLGKAAELAKSELVERMRSHAEYIMILYKILNEQCAGKVEIKVNGIMGVNLHNGNLLDLVQGVANSYKSQNDEQIAKSLMDLGCLPATLSISFKGIESMEIVSKLSQSVCTSVGSACHSKCRQMSAVLAAIGMDESFAFGTFRISVGCGLTKDMVIQAGNLIAKEILLYK